MYKTNKSILPPFRTTFFFLDLTDYFMNILLSYYLFIYLFVVHLATQSVAWFM